MRSWFIPVLMLAAVFGGALTAQSTPGLSIDIVVHEPTADQVGPYIAELHNNSDSRCTNPNYDPLQPTGEPQYLPAYGNGHGIDNELDSISNEFYALASTTTHDLAVLTNNTGADITIDTTSVAYQVNGFFTGFSLESSRAAHDVPNAPEQSSPDSTAQVTIFPYSDMAALQPIVVPDGSSVSVFLIRTKWANRLDTSPRDYIWTFGFDDTTGNTYTVDAKLWVPTVGGGKGNNGCVSDPNGFPTGVWLLATGGLAAIITRRKQLKKAKAKAK